MTQKIKICYQCGFEYTGSGTKYCSEKCRNDRNMKKSAEKRGPKICLNCKKEYIGQGYKYCSNKCRGAHHTKFSSKTGRRNHPLLQYVIDYLPKHKFIVGKYIAREYMEKHETEYFHTPNWEKRLHVLNRKISGWFAMLTSEGYNLVRWSENRPYTYIKTDDMVKGFNDYQNGLYCRSYNDRRNNFKNRKIDLGNYDWRRFEDLEKNEMMTDRGREHPKMHFLGTIETIDPHFRELYEKANI